MSVQFDVWRVRKPAFWVFKKSEIGWQFHGVVTGDDPADAASQALATWGVATYMAVPWWRLVNILEQEVSGAEQSSHPS